MQLTHYSRVAIVGGGPSGSLTAFFLLEMAKDLGIHLNVEIYEPAQFSAPGPKGCNHCGGVISETLMQMLAMEGINLPPGVVQRGVDSYRLHTDYGAVSITTPLDEMRIASLYRGAGPLNCKACTAQDPGQRVSYQSFDGFLLERAVAKGAVVHPNRVTRVSREGTLPKVHAKGMGERAFDLVVGAVGVNNNGLAIFDPSALSFRHPTTTKAFVTEIHLGREGVLRHFGSTMHVFLVRLPRVDFAAVIPKGEYVTVVMLGRDLDKDLAMQFLTHPLVKNCFPAEVDLTPHACMCRPEVCLGAADPPFSDRVVLVGDAAVSRLYKDGNGAAYRTAKALATTALIYGISRQDFARHYRPVCRKLDWDNTIGKAVFLTVDLFKHLPFLSRGMLRMVTQEQNLSAQQRDMSMVLWDTFTGSNSYASILSRTVHPAFLGRLAWESLNALLGKGVA
ncbi:MAG: hypothetical protein G8345_05275 [Magnetococcales bacterium]|nr:hypothetical protein [Magnetococcales bacterium]NGZ26280.1 hypothetical protein [Magnetococcales bacterium]